MVKTYIHPTALIDEGAEIGEGTRVWANAHICGRAKVGCGCNVGQNVYVDNDAIVGNFCKLQNNVNVYDGVILEDYVFCGPSMTFTNVRAPRCEFPRDRGGRWYYKTHVGRGASFGAQSVVVCGYNVGPYALVGSGSVVCEDVLAHALVVGNPAKRIGWACCCGTTLSAGLVCQECGRKYEEVYGFGLREAKEGGDGVH